MGRLFWKIFLAFSSALLIVAAGTGTGVWLQHSAMEGGEPQLALGPAAKALAGMAAATLRHGNVDGLREWMKETGGSSAPLFAVDASGVDVLGRPVSAETVARAHDIATAGNEPGAVRLARAASGEPYLLFVPLGMKTSMPFTAPPPSPWLLIAIAALVSLAMSALLAWYLARPIQKLRWAFDAAASGKLDTRVASRMGRRRDEIADLGRDFDRMAAQIESLVSSQRRLLHDVSHELRSPLTRLQAASGLLRQDPAELEQSVDRIEKETARLDAMVGELLTVARLESGNLKPRLEPVSIGDLMACIVEDARFEAKRNHNAVNLHCDSNATVRADHDLLGRAIDNVVRNALKFAPAGTPIDITVRTDDKRVEIQVADQGPGIPAAELENIFMPFYRGNAGGNVEGYGLGLAIAHRTLVAHGGSISVANRKEGGLIVEMSLPRSG